MENIKESLTVVKEYQIEDDIWDYIMEYILKAEYIKELSGRGKKRYVQEKIRDLLGDEKYSVYSPFISVSIDFIISLSKNTKILKGINISGFLKCLKNSCII